MASLWTELKRRNVIRVALVYAFASWLLIQVADIMFESFGTPDWVMKTFIGFLGLGFPIAVIVAWAFEITPEGLKKEKDVDRSKSTTNETGRKLDYGIIAILAAALIYFMFTHEWGAEDEDSATADKSVAVLPFVNMSADPENEFFSDGLSETLLHMLAQVQGLRVAARTSSFAFKGENKDVREIGRELGVSTVLEGSVQKVGEQLRITAQLVDTEDGSHLWSRSFDRNREDVFALQDEIAVEVVRALKGALFEAEETERLTRRRTDNVEAWQAYLLGIREMPKRSIPALEGAKRQFERAITLDPEFAAAYVGLYDAYALLNEYGSLSRAEVDANEWLLATALLLDPELGEAYASLGLRFSNRDIEPFIFERAFRKAIALAPSYASAYQWYGNALRDRTYRYEEILALHRKAREIDPLSEVININVAFSLFFAGHFDEAISEYEQIIERFPDYPFARWGLGFTYWSGSKDLVRATRELHKYLEMDPQAMRYGSSLCEIYLDLDAPDAAQKCLDRLVEIAPDHWVLDNLRNQIALYLGQPATSIDLSRATLGAIGAARYVRAEFFARDWEGAREHYAQRWPQLFESDPPEAIPNVLLDTLRAAYVLMQMGDEDRGRKLAQDVLEMIERHGQFLAVNREDVIAHAMLGNTDAALAALREIPATGNRYRWWMMRHDPVYDSLRDTPEFQAVIDELAADAARQRAELEAEGLMTVPGA